MSDIVYKEMYKILVHALNVQYYCFQSAEIKECEGSFSDNYYKYIFQQTFIGLFIISFSPFFLFSI